MSEANMEEVLRSIPHLYRGPGGCAAVLKDGALLGKHCWGYANLDERAPMSASTIMPICSVSLRIHAVSISIRGSANRHARRFQISKQFICLATVSLCRTPTPAMLMRKESPWEQLQAEMESLLPEIGKQLKVEELANMQSGIRDYWAM